jgi:hypothetical protein
MVALAMIGLAIEPIGAMIVTLGWAEGEEIAELRRGIVATIVRALNGRGS